jgi:hypothetical protein
MSRTLLCQSTLLSAVIIALNSATPRSRPP